MEKSAFLVRRCVRDSSGIPVDKPDIADSPAAEKKYSPAAALNRPTRPKVLQQYRRPNPAVKFWVGPQCQIRGC